MAVLLTLSLNLAASCTDVFNIAKKYSNYPTLITQISFTESTCGEDILGDDGDSLGIMQLQVPTVRYISSKVPELRILDYLSDRQLQTLLLRDDEVSIIIATHYFLFLKKYYGYKDAVIRYNGYWAVDAGGVAIRDSEGRRMKNVQYYDRVVNNKAIVQDLIKQGK